MTTHFYKSLGELTFDEVWEEVERNRRMFDGCPVPLAYAELSEADWAAYACWCFLDSLEKGKVITPEEWCKNLVEGEQRNMMLDLTRKVKEKFDGENSKRIRQLGH